MLAFYAKSARECIEEENENTHAKVAIIGGELDFEMRKVKMQ